MAISILEVSTFSQIPAFVPAGVLYFTQDTSELYIGTGSSKYPFVSLVSGGGGSPADAVQSISTSQSISLGAGLGNLYIDATAGVSGIALVLPDAASLGGQKITIVMVDTGEGGVTIDTVNNQKIDGGTTYVLTNQWQSATLESNGANWRIVAAVG